VSADRGYRSAFRHALARENDVIQSIEQFTGTLDPTREQRDLVTRVLERIRTAVSEFGYENFVEDVTSGEFFGGDQSPVGSDAIDLIPSDRFATCQSILLAVSRGDKKRGLGFPAIMQKVRAHLIQCVDKTQVVIILCDHWLPGMLDDHLGDLRAHQARGVHFLFLLAVAPGRTLSPVAVDLAMTG
jgi:hypothetical protein